jgi:hypothetical protein
MRSAEMNRFILGFGLLAVTASFGQLASAEIYPVVTPAGKLSLNQTVTTITSSGLTNPNEVVATAMALYESGKISGSMTVTSVVQILGPKHPAVLTIITSLIKSGASPSSVTSAAISAGVDPTLVVSTAVAAGAPRDVVVAAAITAGADPTLITQSSAAGGTYRGGREAREPARESEGRHFRPVITPVPSGGGHGIPVSHS